MSVKLKSFKNLARASTSLSRNCWKIHPFSLKLNNCHQQPPAHHFAECLLAVKQFCAALKKKKKLLLLPSGEGVGTHPWAGDGDAGSNAEARQVGGQGALQQVGAPARCIFCLAHIQALGKETGVVCCLGSRTKTEECKMSFSVHFRLHAFWSALPFPLAGCHINSKEKTKTSNWVKITRGSA